MNVLSCCFCGSKNLLLKYRQQVHPENNSIGKFDLYECKNCSSIITYPLPSFGQLQSLYNSFDGGIQVSVSERRKETPIGSLYIQLFKRVMMYFLREKMNTMDFRWVDVGAGNGEFSELLMKSFPFSRGVAIDFHEKPQRLKGYNSIEWIRADLNQVDISNLTGVKRFDLVISLAVLEHVLYPDKLMMQLDRICRQDGFIYIGCPDSSSIASKLLRNRWPYFIPGEHLNLPSIKGMKKLLQSIKKNESNIQNKLIVKRIWISYPLRYLFNYFGLKLIGKWISPAIKFRFPSGAMEAGMQKRS